AVAAQAALLGASFAAPAPALFVTSALLCATGVRLMRGSPRWLYPAYAGAYCAFQTCGQLVPSQLAQLLMRVREALHYPASQPLPAAYDAVYAAVFVVAGGLIAVLRPRIRPALLTATGWASALAAFMAFGSIWVDRRPSL